MQRNFESALSFVLKDEGGYVNHPRDPGGATNKGITLATFRRYVSRNGTEADLKALTTEQAGIVYRKQYWDKMRGDDLPDGVDYAVFDFAVNSGPKRAAQYLQKVVGAKQDGQVGPKTLIAVMRHDSKQVIEQLCADRLAFLKRLSTWNTFGRGWTARVSAVDTHAREMVRAAQTVPKDYAPPEVRETATRKPTWIIGLLMLALALAGAFFWIVKGA